MHAGLLELVQRELGPHLALANEFGTGAGTRGPTLQSLVDADKRLLFSYVDNSIVGGKLDGKILYVPSSTKCNVYHKLS